MNAMETYNGHVRTPTDAIILFEACRIGLLPRVQRRLSEKERQSIKSGSVFVWDEREAGMRRWTDGKSWSASRVSGSFLTYREMEGKRGSSNFDKNSNRDGVQGNDNESEDGPDGYRYKPDGLMKQSFSIATNSGQHLHLISYFSRSSQAAQALMQPSQDPQLRHIRPEKGMYPESTVHEQSNIPAVTRGPMSSPGYTHAPHQPGQYGARPPYGYGPPPGYPPSPMHTPPPHQYPPYYGHPGHGGYPGQSPLQNMHYPPPGYAQQPMTAFDRPPPPLSNNALPPPPPYGMAPHGYQPPYGYAPGYGHYQPPPLHQPPPVYPPPQQQPVPTPAPASAVTPTFDPKPSQSQAPPPPPSQPQAQAQSTPQQEDSNLNREIRQDSHQAGKPDDSPKSDQQTSAGASQPAAQSTAPGSSGQTIPSISAMLNGGGDGQPPPRNSSRSPNDSSARPLQDIPMHKLGFEASRDVQALRNLDKSTFKY